MIIQGEEKEAKGAEARIRKDYKIKIGSS